MEQKNSSALAVLLYSTKNVTSLFGFTRDGDLGAIVTDFDVGIGDVDQEEVIAIDNGQHIVVASKSSPSHK